MISRPPRKVHFAVDIEGVGTNLSFQEVSGLGVETQLVDYRAGSSERFATVKTPKIAKPGSVTLKRGIIAKDDGFSEWHALIGQNAARRATVAIRLLDESGAPLMVWTLTNAFPKKISAPDLNANANEVAIESLELEHEGLTIADDD